MVTTSLRRMRQAQPTIDTSRLRLRPFVDSDVEDIFTYASNAEVARFVSWSPHETHKDSEVFLNWIRTTTAVEPGKTFFVFAVASLQSKKVIGSIGFQNVNPLCGQIDYALSRDHWGQGLMSEAALALKEWALFTQPSLVRLQSFCMAGNQGSRRVMEKMGMEYEGTLRKSMMVKGAPADIAHYALIR